MKHEALFGAERAFHDGLTHTTTNHRTLTSMRPIETMLALTAEIAAHAHACEAADNSESAVSVLRRQTNQRKEMKYTLDWSDRNPSLELSMAFRRKSCEMQIELLFYTVDNYAGRNFPRDLSSSELNSCGRCVNRIKSTARMFWIFKSSHALVSRIGIYVGSRLKFLLFSRIGCCWRRKSDT